MCKILLSKKKANIWRKHDKLYFCGGCERNNLIIKNTCFEEKEIEFIVNNKEELRTTYGNFVIIYEDNEKIVAAVDRISSFPLYYGILHDEHDELVISDDINLIMKELEISFDDIGVREFTGAGFYVGNKTIYKGVSQIQAGQVLRCNKVDRNMFIDTYFEHIHIPLNLSVEEYIYKLDQAVMNSMERLVRSIDGKTILLFLSGGFDSKLVVSSRYRLNYENVICISTGDRHIKIVLVVTGNSGDAVEGNDVPHCFDEGREYSFEEILEAIRKEYFRLVGEKLSYEIAFMGQ